MSGQPEELQITWNGHKSAKGGVLTLHILSHQMTQGDIAWDPE